MPRSLSEVESGRCIAAARTIEPPPSAERDTRRPRTTMGRFVTAPLAACAGLARELLNSVRRIQISVTYGMHTEDITFVFGLFTTQLRWRHRLQTPAVCKRFVSVFVYSGVFDSSGPVASTPLSLFWPRCGRMKRRLAGSTTCGPAARRERPQRGSGGHGASQAIDADG